MELERLLGELEMPVAPDGRQELEVRSRLREAGDRICDVKMRMRSCRGWPCGLPLEDRALLVAA
jgi:hypothetical protein